MMPEKEPSIRCRTSNGRERPRRNVGIDSLRILSAEKKEWSGDKGGKFMLRGRRSNQTYIVSFDGGLTGSSPEV